MSMANLVSIYQNQGRCNEADEPKVPVMDTGKRVLGQEHPDSLKNMDNLALTYSSNGRREAEELVELVMRRRSGCLARSILTHGRACPTWRRRACRASTGGRRPTSCRAC